MFWKKEKIMNLQEDIIDMMGQEIEFLHDKLKTASELNDVIMERNNVLNRDNAELKKKIESGCNCV